MIKRTDVLSSIKTDKHLILIPGGPGISSMSIRDLDLLKRSFHLHYVDFPGTNNNPYLGKKSFDELSDLLLDEIKRIDGQVFCLGHSYGGLFAMDMAIQSACDGIICMATSFTQRSLSSGSMADEVLIHAKNIWIERPSDQTFRQWLEAYQGCWFASHSRNKGKKLMASDPVSAQFYIDNEDDIYKNESLLKVVSKLKTRKVLIAGEDDRTLSWEQLKADAALGNFEFISVQNASHFVMVDQPEIIARIVERVSI